MAQQKTEEFSSVSFDTWLEMARESLKGRDPKVSVTDDGMRIEPLYPLDGSVQPVPRAYRGRAGAPWRISSAIEKRDAKAMNKIILEELEGGVNALHLTALAKDQLKTALKGVDLSLIHLSLGSGDYRADCLDILKEAASASMGLDPLGDFACRGKAEIPLLQLMGKTATTAKQCAGDNIRPVTIDSALYHTAGAGDVQELAIAAASLVTWLRTLEAEGMDAEQAASMITVTMAAGSQQVTTVAKFRALRLLWREILTHADVKGVEPQITAVAAERLYSKTDPYVNILRATADAMWAGLGGANEVRLLPYTARLGLAGGEARRLTRNIHIILQEESGLHHIADPMAGAPAVESLTRQMAESAFAMMQAIEGQGGMVRVLESGWLKTRVDDVAENRRTLLRARKMPLTGTSEFATLEEREAPTDGPISDKGGDIDEGLAFQPHVLSEEYEALRERAGAMKPEPVVTLITMGPLKDYSARATFMKNALAAGGIDIQEVALDDVEKAGLKGAVVCLVGSDTVYEELAPQALSATKAAEAKSIWLAGGSEATRQALTAQGVEGVFYLGMDLVETLNTILDTLEGQS